MTCNHGDNALQWRAGGLAASKASGTRWQWQGPFRNEGAGAEVLFLDPSGVLKKPLRQRQPVLSADLLPTEQEVQAEIAKLAKVNAKTAISKQSARERKTDAGACLYFPPSYFLSASFIYCYLTSCLPHVYLVRTCLFTSCLPVFLPLLPHVYLLLLTYRTEGKAEEGEEKKKKTPEKPSGKKPKSADASGGKPSGKKPKSADASAAAPPEGSSSGAASSSSGAAASSSSKAVELVHLRHVFTSCLPLHYIDTSALPHVYLTLHRVYLTSPLVCLTGGSRS